MKLEGAGLKMTRKVQGSVTLEYLAQGSSECRNVYMGSREEGINT